MPSAVSQDAKPMLDLPSATCPHCDAAGHGSALCSTCARALTVCGGVRLGAEIDRGGVARIHDARTVDGTDAAVKVLERTAIHSAAVHRLFARSARLISGLSHPGLPRVFGFETNRRRSFLAMERLHGGTLWARVAHKTGKMRGADVDRLLRGLLEAIHHLHDRGLIHGDVTPRNVMFRAENDRQPVLVDFDGLCTTGERDVASLVMTPGYTAPEQRVGELTVGSDLYGIGATVVFAATGKAPDRLERGGEHMDLDLGVADLSPKTRELLQRLVALDTERRPKSAAAALDALDALEVVTTLAPAERPIRATRSPGAALRARSSATPLVLVAALLVLLVFTLAVGVIALVGVAPARPI